MEALKRKWNSSGGASILLALLFLLICVMAGASVVMAASSNAGKIRSNREEQQKYLTLTSALTLLCDELQSVKYEGRYTITKEGPEDSDREKPGDSSSGDVTYYTNTYYTYTQMPGEFQQRTGSKLNLDDDDMKLLNLLDLTDVWDSIFAEQFIVKNDDGTYQKDDYEKYVMKESRNTIKNDWEIYQYDTYVLPYFDSETKEYTLTFQVTESGTSDGFEEPVTITVTGMNENGTIILRARLKDMEVRATLEPNGTKPNGLELLDTAILKDIRYEEVKDDDGNILKYIYKGVTDPVTWELVAIEKYQEEVSTDE